MVYFLYFGSTDSTCCNVSLHGAEYNYNRQYCYNNATIDSIACTMILFQPIALVVTNRIEPPTPTTRLQGRSIGVNRVLRYP
jgi:hypothetical protein